jgi:hypothetical protein
MEPTTSTDPTVHLSLLGPGPQRRWTVALRVFLAIPHFLWLGLVMFVALFAVAIGWVCAIVIGRLPTGIREFVAKALRYQTRVMGYAYYLMSDRYPPFSLSDDDYAVELLVPPAGRLNRAAVLFRFILVIPAMIVAAIVGAGVGIPLVVLWLVTLVTGRMPRAGFEALSAVLRYQMRTYAFTWMVTSEYPKALFGDGDRAPGSAPLDAPDATASGAPASTVAPRITRLHLSKGGKRLVVVFLVLGVLSNVGSVASGNFNVTQSDSALEAFEDIDAELGDAARDYNRTAQACAIEGGLPCLQDANADFADAVATFRADLADIAFPATAFAQADLLDQRSSELEDVLRELAVTEDPNEYQELVAELQVLVQQVSEEEIALADALTT